LPQGEVVNTFSLAAKPKARLFMRRLFDLAADVLRAPQH
jgi:hypothetical protein